MNGHHKSCNKVEIKYNAKISEKSLDNIAKQSIGETLSCCVSQELVRDVCEDIRTIIRSAAKYATRTHSNKLQLRHLQYAMCEHGVSLDLVEVDYGNELITELTSTDSDSDEDQPPVIMVQEQQTRNKPKEQQMSIVPRVGTLRHTSGWLRREQVQLRANQKYPLSMEQQCFYELLTETCVGYSESKRREALQTMNMDPSLQAVLPSLSLFIAEAVKLNVVNKNLSILMWLMRMVRALLGNTNLSLQKYMHLFIPSVLSCVLSKRLCAHPLIENHWALREYAGNIMAEIVKHFHTNNNLILSRIVCVYQTALQRKSLQTIYGAVIGLGKLGNYVIRAVVIPETRHISSLIESKFDTNEAEPLSEEIKINKQAANYIRHRMLKICTPILKNLRTEPDEVREYVEDHGFLGSSLCEAVRVVRIKAKGLEDAKAAIEQEEADWRAKAEQEQREIMKVPAATKPNLVQLPSQSLVLLPKIMPPAQMMNGLTSQLSKPYDSKSLSTTTMCRNIASGATKPVIVRLVNGVIPASIKNVNYVSAGINGINGVLPSNIKNKHF